MSIAEVNGIRLHYDEYGVGEPVVLVTGTGAPGRIWRTHQVPALRAAGFRPVTVDNRGIAPTDAGDKEFTLDDMAADVAGLIEHLGAGPCRVVGFSLGAMIVQELLIARPELVREAVLIATAARTDALGAAMAEADVLLAAISAVHNLSPETLNDEARLRDWLDVFEFSSISAVSVRAQLGLQIIPDRRPGLGKVTCPCLVIGFRDDLIVRPHLCREVAAAIPGARYREIDGCGHYGYLERPDAVNAEIVGFLCRP